MALMLMLMPTVLLQVIDIINEEEKLFLKTLSRGRKVFERAIATVSSVSSVIPGTQIS